jgi:hypothetical protein
LVSTAMGTDRIAWRSRRSALRTRTGGKMLQCSGFALSPGLSWCQQQWARNALPGAADAQPCAESQVSQDLGEEHVHVFGSSEQNHKGRCWAQIASPGAADAQPCTHTQIGISDSNMHVELITSYC